MATFTALLDANVLVSMTATDLALHAARAGLYRARWSDDIHHEWMKAVADIHPNVTPEMLTKRRNAMDDAFRDARVTTYQPLIEGLALPDPKDRHVLAAAIAGRCDVIVTFNTKDFPANALAKHDLDAQHPDTFFMHQYNLAPTVFLGAVKAVLANLTNPPMGIDEYLERLRNVGLPLLADELAKSKRLL